MPFVGTDFNNLIDIKSDRAYSTYFDNTQKNIIVREALYKAINLQVVTDDKILIQDNLFGIYKTDQVFAPASNVLSLIVAGTGITDYYHMMNLSAKFVQVMQSAVITDATNTTPIRITFSRDTNLRTGSNIVVSGITTNTNANGTRYLKRLNNKVYELYSDINLQNPVAGNGVYSGTVGIAYNITYNYAKDLKKNRKFSVLNEPTVHSPFYEIGSTNVKIYPDSVPCSEVTVDYISTPVLIDVGDATTDLLAFYNDRFLEFVADEACRLMGMYSRDTELNQGETAEIFQQP